MPKIPIAVQLGARVRVLRTELGFSQEGFADRVGIHRTYIGAIERGEKVVSIETADRLALALGMKISELLKDL